MSTFRLKSCVYRASNVHIESRVTWVGYTPLLRTLISMLTHGSFALDSQAKSRGNLFIYSKL